MMWIKCSNNVFLFTATILCAYLYITVSHRATRTIYLLPTLYTYICIRYTYTKCMYDWFVFVGQVQVVDSAVRRSNTSQLSDGPKDGSVLRRVAKVTLDQATKDQKPVRPKHVPEKLDFRNREKFEGKRFFVRCNNTRTYIYYNIDTYCKREHPHVHRCESNCILHKTGFRLFFGYDQRPKGRKKDTG